MYTNPQIGGKRQRDLQDRAEQQRRAQRSRGGFMPRMMARLRTVIPHPARQIADPEAAGDSRTD
jgi:hypothetical protein